MLGEGTPAREIAGYRIRSVLGEGGMGIVYLAERPQGGLCALKVLLGRRDADVAFATRFKREAEYAEALDHPNILELYETGEMADGTPFFAMQYVDGLDLAALLAREGPLDVAAAAEILGQVAGALDAAHATGLIHRDVKPQNIIVARDQGATPHAYLTDFGLSKNPTQDSVALTRQGQLIGTMAYAAPEEILGEARGKLVDVYSLGCVMYEALTGEPPFVRERELDVLYAHIGDPRPRPSVKRPDLPEGTDAVIARAMAIPPTDRYPSCGGFVAAVRALAPGPPARPAAAEPVPAPVSAPPPAAVPPVVAPVGPSPAPRSPSAPAPASASTDTGAAPQLGGPLRLVVRKGLGLGRQVDVTDELALGRLTTLDGALAADRGISRRHGRIVRDPDRGFVVEDLYSANGTFVNGIRIDAPTPLRPGDEVRIGATVLAVEPPATEDPLATAASPAVAEVAVGGDHGGRRLVLRVEVDLDAGEVVIAINGGPTTRITRDGGDDGAWSVTAP